MDSVDELTPFRGPKETQSLRESKELIQKIKDESARLGSSSNV